jgi:hypothetical protein
MMQLREALAWARAGGIAVHDTGFPYRSRGGVVYEHTCHLFANGTDALVAAARASGCAVRWIQRPGTSHEHYDLFGAPLRKALALCERDNPKTGG